jgi:acetyl esterase
MPQQQAPARAAALDPQIRVFAQRLLEAYAAEPVPADVVERRRIAEHVRETWSAGGPEMAETRELTVAGLRVRLHRPSDAPDLPVLLYVHGGGWVLFSIDTHDRLMREYAARAGVAVIGVDYSLSPEAKFPTALNEIGTVLDWVEANGADYGLDPSRMLIGGDSVGANMAVAACLARRDQGKPALAGMVLSYGAFAPECTESYGLYSGPDYILEGTEMDAYWADYVEHPDQLAKPLVAPLKADLHDMPPAFVAVAECDVLADCNRAFAAKLRAAGVPVEEVTYPGATHSFLEAVSIAPLADRALGDQSRWIVQRCKAGAGD